MSYTIINVAKDLVTGKLRFATAVIARDRRSICDSCEIQRNKVCTACGCYLPLKTRLRDSNCPLELW